MPRINLLPWRDQERKERRVSFLVWLGFSALAAALACVAAYLLFDSLINAQNQRNLRLQGEIKTVDRQIEQINDLEAQKQRFISRMQVIDKLQRSRSEEVHLFDEIATTIPDATYLTSFTQDNRKLKFEGIAQSSTRVSAFMRNITASQWMRNPDLEVVEVRSGNGVGSVFVLNAEQVSPTAPADDADKTATKPKRGGS
ncbi:MAG: PilN domain-containing protein [Steroidobacteraceae bacterium]|jgi:type IV pilus assembly protein PilN